MFGIKKFLALAAILAIGSNFVAPNFVKADAAQKGNGSEILTDMVDPETADNIKGDAKELMNSVSDLAEEVKDIDAETIHSELSDLTDEVLKRQKAASAVQVDDDDLPWEVQAMNESGFVKVDNNGKIHVIMPSSKDLGEDNSNKSTVSKTFTFILDLGAAGLDSVAKIINSVTD